MNTWAVRLVGAEYSISVCGCCRVRVALHATKGFSARRWIGFLAVPSRARKRCSARVPNWIHGYNGLSMAFKRTCSSTRTNGKKNSVSRGSATIVMLEERRIKAIWKLDRYRRENIIPKQDNDEIDLLDQSPRTKGHHELQQDYSAGSVVN